VCAVAVVMFTIITMGCASAHDIPSPTLASPAPSGRLHFPATGYYLPAVLSGTTVYTIFDPSGQPLDQAVSATVQITANLIEGVVVIAVLILVILLCIFLYRRRLGRQAHSAIQQEGVAKPAGELPEEWREIQSEPLLPAPPMEAPPMEAPPVKAPPMEAPPVKAPPVKAPPVKARPTAAEAINKHAAALDQAREAFRQEDDELAISTLFDTAVASLSEAAHIRLSAQMTHSEKCWAIQASLPGVRDALRELTTSYELVHYGGRSLTQAQSDAALKAFESLQGYLFS